MNKTIQVRNLNNTNAHLAITANDKLSTTTLVLSELIYLSQLNTHTFYKDALDHTTDKLKITEMSFRKAIHDLKELNLIIKVGNTILLKELASHCTQIIIKQETI